MKTQLTNPIVNIDLNNGQVTISNLNPQEDERLKDVLTHYYSKKAPGRMFLADAETIVFDLYNRGANSSTVHLKEEVGQTVVTRSAKAVKFSLSLPVAMTQHQMIMSVIEQSTLLSEALRNGLYERMVKGDENLNVA